MPGDDVGGTPPFAVRIGNEKSLSKLLPGKAPIKRWYTLEPGAQLAVEVDFRRQKKVFRALMCFCRCCYCFVIEFNL